MEDIKIGNKEYSVTIVSSPEDRAKGLQDVKSLPENQGMLFVFEEPKHVDFWMKDTLIPLDIIFIDSDEKVISVAKGQPKDQTLHGEDDVNYVLEVNIDSGIKKGDELQFSDEMKVLAPDGSVQMSLQGGERMVSRKQTLILIRKAKTAYNSKTDKDYKSLGKYMFRVLKGQDNRDPEYVNAPK